MNPKHEGALIALCAVVLLAVAVAEIYDYSMRTTGRLCDTYGAFTVRNDKYECRKVKP